MRNYKRNRRASKTNQRYDCNNEKQSSTTKQNKTDGEKDKWNSYMNNYGHTRRASKTNQRYDCNNEKQSSTTKQNKIDEQKKRWNSYMNNYRRTGRASKKKQGYKFDNERQSSPLNRIKKLNIENQKREKVQSIAALISRFQNIVSEGPLYICSCCDQL